MTKITKGVLTALLTPFHTDETIDFNSLEKLTTHCLSQGVDGLYVCGSTGEAFLMDAGERREVLQTVANIVKGTGKQMIAHIGTIGTRETIKMAKDAEEAGFDAISSIPPFYYPINFKQLYRHYKTVTESCNLPMVVYNFPALSGVNMSPVELGELLELPGVIGLKQTESNPFAIERISSAHPDKLLYNGFDEMFLAGQIAGANGGIGSTYNVMGDRYQQIKTKALAGDIEGAREIQFQANNVISKLIEVGVIPGLKAILQQQGVIADRTCRQPLDTLDDKTTTELFEFFKAN